MSQYYNAKRTRNLYDPVQHGPEPAGSGRPFRLSRSKLELFTDCPRCFYLDRRLGVARPPGYPFALNSAVDCLLKKEFDEYRARKEPHPLMERYGVGAVPAGNENLGEWRDNFKGVQYLHEPTNLMITGAIDDLWVSAKGEYIVVDYKATSKNERIDALNKEWQDGYKRQMEIYQWLFRRKGYKVSDIGYFVYCNGITDKDAFNAKLEFDITLIAYEGDDSWVEETIVSAHKCLNGDNMPPPSDECDYCAYREAAAEAGSSGGGRESSAASEAVRR